MLTLENSYSGNSEKESNVSIRYIVRNLSGRIPSSPFLQGLFANKKSNNDKNSEGIENILSSVQQDSCYLIKEEEGSEANVSVGEEDPIHPQEILRGKTNETIDG